MSADRNHLVAAHRLKNLSELMRCEPRLKAELEALGVDARVLSGVALFLADVAEGKAELPC